MATGMDPGRAAMLGAADSTNPVAINATMARQSRRLYVGQIPYNINEEAIGEFFNSTMIQMDLATSPPVLSVQVNHDKNYAFVEVSTFDHNAVKFWGTLTSLRCLNSFIIPIKRQLRWLLTAFPSKDRL